MQATVAMVETLADLLTCLGDMPPSRVRLHPPPGTATERDVLDIQAREGRLCELVDSVLVEKGIGWRESYLAGVLIEILRRFVRPCNLGLVTAPDGMMRLAPGLVRLPDVAFISWERIPNRRIPEVPLPDLVPDLAVEILSASNTPAEMARKRREYFAAGVRLVWQVHPETHTVEVYTAPEQATLLAGVDVIEGGTVLPGFALPVHTLFAELDLEG